MCVAFQVRTAFVVLVDCFLYLCASINKYSVLGWGINFLPENGAENQKFRHKIDKFKMFFFFLSSLWHFPPHVMWRPNAMLWCHGKQAKLADNKNREDFFFNSHRKLETLFACLRSISAADFWIEVRLVFVFKRQCVGTFFPSSLHSFVHSYGLCVCVRLLLWVGCGKADGEPTASEV